MSDRTTKSEFLRRWHQVRWSWYFAGFLTPLILLATLLGHLLGDPLTGDGSPATWLLMAVAALFALFLAGLFDGPERTLGQCAWGLVLFAVSIQLTRRILRSGNTEERRTVRFAGHGFEVIIENRADHWERRRHRWLPNESERESRELVHG